MSFLKEIPWRTIAVLEEILHAATKSPLYNLNFPLLQAISVGYGQGCGFSYQVIREANVYTVSTAIDHNWIPGKEKKDI